MNLNDMPFELTPLEGEDRRRVVEGLKMCIESYPELREHAVELAQEVARKERLMQETTILAYQCGRRLGRPLTDAERHALMEGYGTAWSMLSTWCPTARPMTFGPGSRCQSRPHVEMGK